jgi:hypothetical protein
MPAVIASEPGEVIPPRIAFMVEEEIAEVLRPGL